MTIITRKPFVGGNWKCNGTIESINKLCTELKDKVTPHTTSADVVVCPSTIYMDHVAQRLPKKFVCCQDVSQTSYGAYTGETSCEMLKDCGIQWTLVGHSERRTKYHETDDVVAAKVDICQKHSIHTVVCLGEKLSERDANQTTDVLKRQLNAVIPKITDFSKIVFAYQPIKDITHQQVQEAHLTIRNLLKERVSDAVATSIRIIYGDHVSANNCHDLVSQQDVDGFLVGHDSLVKPESFIKIIESTVSVFSAKAKGVELPVQSVKEAVLGQ